MYFLQPARLLLSPRSRLWPCAQRSSSHWAGHAACGTDRRLSVSVRRNHPRAPSRSPADYVRWQPRPPRWGRNVKSEQQPAPLPARRRATAATRFISSVDVAVAPAESGADARSTQTPTRTPGVEGLRRDRRGAAEVSVGSLVGTIELPGRRDRGLKQGRINRTPEPYDAGVGERDLQLRPRDGVDDRHRHGAGNCGVSRCGPRTCRAPRGLVPRGVGCCRRDTFLPVIERRETDAEAPAEFGDGQVCGLLACELAAPPFSPVAATWTLTDSNHDNSPGTAPDSVRGSATTPGVYAPSPVCVVKVIDVKFAVPEQLR